MASSTQPAFKYDSTSLPCRVCNKPFTNADSVQKFGERYVHAKCFVCKLCQAAFSAPNQAWDVKGLPYCSACEHQGRMETCKGCGKPIDGQMMKLKNDKYHPACVRCSACNEQLTSAFRERNKQIFCLSCAQNGFKPK